MTSPSHDLCRCLGQRLDRPPQIVKFHKERQDTQAPGWQRLLELIEEAAEDRRKEFKPLTELTPKHRRQIVTLPPTIGRLTSVRHLVLYRSNLVRIPPEIGMMTSLEEFDPYTSYRLHWFPYELTRCPNLKPAPGYWYSMTPALKQPASASSMKYSGDICSTGALDWRLPLHFC